MTDPIIPAWLAETFGGRFYSYPPRAPGHKGVTHWQIENALAAEFLALIADRLKIKRAQAELVIAYYGDPRIERRRRRGIPEDELALRREYVSQIHVLNKRGAEHV